MYILLHNYVYITYEQYILFFKKEKFNYPHCAQKQFTSKRTSALPYHCSSAEFWNQNLKKVLPVQVTTKINIILMTASFKVLHFTTENSATYHVINNML